VCVRESGSALYTVGIVLQMFESCHVSNTISGSALYIPSNVFPTLGLAFQSRPLDHAHDGLLG